MMYPSKIRAKLTQHEPVLCICCHLTDPAVHEMAGLMGFDGIWMDMEHHVYSLQTAQELFRAARLGSGADILARPAAGEWTRIMRMLEAGAHAILYPRCSDADEAKQVVKAMKFFPQGERGCDGGNRDMPFCHIDTAAYNKEANEQTVLFCQIETPASLEQAYKILEVEGVDGLFFGPNDFSVESGIPGQTRNNPVIDNAIKQIADAAKQTGKHWGIPSAFENASKYLDMGATLICHGADIMLVKAGYQKIQDNFSRLGFSFDNVLDRRKSEIESKHQS
tara:strand:+ start:81 stop:917 length:837 start_codon:yes stop_codon:yes gene_type:complete